MSPSHLIAIARALPELNHLRLKTKLGQHDVNLLYWGSYEPRYWRNYLHTHSFLEVCFVYRGNGIYRLRGVDLPVRKGDLFIAKAGQEHEIVSSRQNPMGIYYWAFSLHRRSQADGESSSVDRLLEHLLTAGDAVVHRVNSIVPTLSLIANEISNHPAGYPLALESLAARLILCTARAAASGMTVSDAVPMSSKGEAERLVANASRYIHDNFARPLLLRDIASQVHVSERHLARLFKEVKRCTVLEVITQARLDAAARMLIERDWPLKRIAAAVGYGDVRHFITIFRKRMKITPRQFRLRGGTVFATAK